MATVAGQIDIDAVSVLIECMHSTPPLGEDLRLRLWKEHAQAVTSVMLAEGKSWGEAAGGALAFIVKPDAEAFVASIEHDLGAQTEIVSKSFAEYLTTGEIPAPYYAWRICIWLRKAGRRDLELDFLKGWGKHFAGRGIGQRYVMLNERLNKMMTSHHVES